MKSLRIVSPAPSHLLVDGAPARVTSVGYRRPGDASPSAFVLADGSRLARRELGGWLIARPGEPITGAVVHFAGAPGAVDRARAERLFLEACASLDAGVRP